MGAAGITLKATPRYAEARVLKGLSQMQLTELVGFGQASVSRYERGEPMRMRTAQKLVGALGLSIEQAVERKLLMIVRDKPKGATRGTRKVRTRARVG